MELLPAKPTSAKVPDGGATHRTAKLRTKTGCLTCRARRKKCDEKLPVCGRCSQSKRECLWPTSTDLVDRRYSSHEGSRYSNESRERERRLVSTVSAASPPVSRLSESVAHHIFSNDLEIMVTQHFINKYYRLLLLPNCHPDFFNSWISEIQKSMGEWKSVRYSMLCNAASNLHLIESSNMMQELALTYYSKALRGLSDMISRAEPVENSNSILMSMMLLYLHGVRSGYPLSNLNQLVADHEQCVGRGTYFDIPQHLNAATRVLTLRMFQETSTVNNPFDRVSMESVLYQVFLASTGLWSDETSNHKMDFSFDPNFWLQAERVLDQSKVFPGQSSALNSPVLGVPVSLFRLALTLRKMYQGSFPYDETSLDELRSEVEVWEGFVLCDRETDELSDTEEENHRHEYYKSAGYLYILIVSLLLEKLDSLPLTPVSSAENTDDSSCTISMYSRPPPSADPESWQVRKAVQILERHEHDDEWASSFLGSWPVYTIGFFLATPDHIQLVLKDLNRRWNLTKFDQVARYSSDLEKTWIQRGLLPEHEIELSETPSESSSVEICIRTSP